MMKNLVTIILLTLPLSLFSQSVTIKDLEKFTQQDWSISEDYLTNRSFNFVRIKKAVNGESVKVYNNLTETIFLGLTYKTKDGKIVKSVTYMTDNIAFVLNLLSQTQKEKLEYKSDTPSEPGETKGKFIILENENYSVQVFMPENQKEESGIIIAGK